MRCAICGSTRIVTEVKNEGYNQKKGIVGIALFGAVGAIAGTGGNKTTYYHCGDCGKTLNKCMDEIEEMELNFALETQDNYSFLERTKEMVKKYPNAEWEQNVISNTVFNKNSSIKVCNLEVMEECLKLIKKYKKLSHKDLEKYMLELGYLKNVIDEIPKNTTIEAYNKNKIKLSLENNELYYEYYDNNELINEHLFNGEIKKLKHSISISDWNYSVYSFKYKDKIDQELKRAKTVTAQEEQEIEKKIIDAIQDGKKISRGDLNDSLSWYGYSVMKISPVLKRMVENNLIIEEKIDGGKYYSKK